MYFNFETSFARFELLNGIAYFTYKPIAFLHLEIAKTIVAERIQFQNGVAYPVLCDTRGIFDIERSARVYLAREGSTLITAAAIFDNRVIAKAMVHFYLHKHRPLIPTLFVDNKDEGIDFLKKYIT